MLQNVLNFLLYNEKRQFVQRNVVLLTRVALLYVCVIIHHLLFRDDGYNPIYDIISMSFVALLALGIKKYGVYYSNISFIILVPLLNWLLFESINRNGITSCMWSFPIIACLFFGFYKYMALLATFFTVVTTVVASFNIIPINDVFRLFMTLIIVIACFTSMFFTFYRQYDLLQDRVKKDALTNVFNRSTLNEVLTESIQQQQNSLAPIGLYFDLDNFKYVNDTFGHHLGDLALINLTKLLQKQINDGDTLFRMGGEEFLIVLNHVSLEQAMVIAENIRAETAKNDLINNGHLLTVSIGVAVHRDDEEWNMWLKRADSAMYQAKQTGKNKVVIAE